MKVCLYFEGENVISKSGIGRAMKHQMRACEIAGIDYTTDPKEDYDILHINTVGLTSSLMIHNAKNEGKKVIYHAHSTEEDFRNSFVLSNQVAPLFKMHLVNLYSSADYILTPTPYSKSLLESYGIEVPIQAISNGVDLSKYEYDADKVKAYRKYFHLKEEDKVVLSVGLYFERKGIIDFMDVARKLPQYKFIWFGHTSKVALPKNVRQALDEAPFNVILPGYVKGGIIEGAFADSDVFFFPSLEETEGIVVLEALAGKQEVIVRDIGVYDPWLVDKVNCYKGNSVEQFAQLIHGVIEKKLPSVKEEGWKTAQQRSLKEIGDQLKEVYERVLAQKD